MSRREHLFWLTVHGLVMILGICAVAECLLTRRGADAALNATLSLANAMFALAHASCLVAGEPR